MGIGEMILMIVFFAVVAAGLYAYNGVMFFSQEHGDKGCLSLPKWLRVLAVVFTPVTVVVFFAIAVMAMLIGICLLIIESGKYVLTGRAWRRFKQWRNASDTWESDQTIATERFNAQAHDMIDSYTNGHGGNS